MADKSSKNSALRVPKYPGVKDNTLAEALKEMLKKKRQKEEEEPLWRDDRNDPPEEC